MEAVGDAVAELHQGRRAGLDVGGIEHGEIAAVLPCAPNHREQPAVAFGGILGSFDENRLGDGVAGRQQVMAEPSAVAVDMDDAGERAEHR